MKKKIVPLILTLVVWFVLFYIYLPPLNLKSPDFWVFATLIIVIALVLNMITIINFIKKRRNPEKKQISPAKLVGGVVLFFVAFYFIGSVLSSPILRSKAYYNLLQVKNGNFKEDIKEVDFNQIPLLDKDSAAKLAERKMGSMADMVSQFEVSNYYSQINYKGKPARVTPLEYGDTIKWLTNTKNGIPAYFIIDMTTQNVEAVKLENGIKYSPSEFFGRDLSRYIRFRYPTFIFGNLKFEIDDNGTPFWVCPVIDKTIGLFGGADIKGIVLVNAIDGDNKYYETKDIPQWIDIAFDADIIINQYNYHGKLVNGYINSIFGQKGCLQSTEGYNYIALDDDVWLYTGVTSVGADQSNVGFVLVNQRTKEAKYYQVSGAKETSAMSSAQGQVQHLGYNATFPILININEEPTYFLALKDAAGLVKKYAMVNVERYQIVAIGDTVSSCEKAYKLLLKENGIKTTETETLKSVTGTISKITDVVIDGNTFFYVMIDVNLYEIKASENINFIKKNVGDTVTFEISDEYQNDNDVYQRVLTVK